MLWCAVIGLAVMSASKAQRWIGARGKGGGVAVGGGLTGERVRVASTAAVGGGVRRVKEWLVPGSPWHLPRIDPFWNFKCYEYFLASGNQRKNYLCYHVTGCQGNCNFPPRVVMWGGEGQLNGVRFPHLRKVQGGLGGEGVTSPGGGVELFFCLCFHKFFGWHIGR